VKYRNRARNTTIVGTNYDFQDIRNLYVEIGSFVPEKKVKYGSRLCVLGRKVKKELFKDENPLGRFMKIGESRFRVIGIMEKKGRSLGFDIDDLVFIPVGAAEKLFNTNRLLEILVAAHSTGEVDQVVREIKEVLVKRHRDTEDFTVIKHAEILGTFNMVLLTLTYVLGGIAGISLVVGGIGIMNIMLVSVGERTREIGLRKAVGAKKRDILAQFLIEASTLSCIGGLVGIALGIGLANLLTAIVPELPTRISLWAVTMATTFSLAVGIFFGVYPARKASQLNPIDALRYE
jgi:putative ABC transport system permease protein